MPVNLDEVIWRVSISLNLTLVVLLLVQACRTFSVVRYLAYLGQTSMLCETPFLMSVYRTCGSRSSEYHALYCWCGVANILLLTPIFYSLDLRIGLEKACAVLMLLQLLVKIDIAAGQDFLDHYRAPVMDNILRTAFDLAWTFLLCVSLYNRLTGHFPFWRKRWSKKDRSASIPVEFGLSAEPMATRL